jgi:hypothetical protein
MLFGGVIGAATGGLILFLIYGDVSWVSVALAAFIGILVVAALQLGEPPAKSA